MKTNNWHLAANPKKEFMVIFCLELRVVKYFKQPENILNLPDEAIQGFVKKYVDDYYLENLPESAFPERYAESARRYIKRAKILCTYSVESVI